MAEVMKNESCGEVSESGEKKRTRPLTAQELRFHREEKGRRMGQRERVSGQEH